MKKAFPKIPKIPAIPALPGSAGNKDFPAQLERLMKEFSIDVDSYRDADGNIRCPVSQERRDQLKAMLRD